jgi:hypothetical protein
VADRSYLLEVDVHDAFSELGNERMSTGKIFALPAPAEAREHVECEPDVFEGCMSREGLAFRHVSVEDDHGGDMEGNGRGEEGDVGEANQLVVHDDSIVRRYDSWGDR